MVKQVVTEEMAERALHFLIKSCSEAAEARAQADAMDDYAKILEAQLMQKHSDIPIAAQKREALADPQYKEFAENRKEASRRWYELQFKRDAASHTISAFQTQSANERAMRI